MSGQVETQFTPTDLAGMSELMIPLRTRLLADLATLAQLDGRTLDQYVAWALDQHVNGRRAVLEAIHINTQAGTNEIRG